MNSINHDLFNSIYEATFNELGKYVYFRVKRLEDAQDIVQSVYMDYYRYVFLKKRNPENVLGYLKQMASNQISKYYKKQQWSVESSEENQELIEQIPSDDNVVLDVFEKFEHAMLWDAVKSLGIFEEKVIIAKFRFDMTFKEIADAMSTNENTIKSNYYRALIKLRKKLENETI